MRKEMKQQLAALVDGELTPREREALSQLLHESPELQEWFRKLCADADHLKALPRHALPEGFADTVLDEIRSRRLAVTKAKVRRTQWWPAAAAAVVILAAGLGTYILLTDLPHQGHPVVQGPSHEPSRSNLPGQGGAGLAIETIHVPPRVDPQWAWHQFRKDLPDLRALRDPLGPLQDAVRPVGDGLRGLLRFGSTEMARVTDIPPDALATETVPFSKALVTSPIRPPTGFKTLDVRLPLFQEPRNLDAAKLLIRLREDSLHHIDLSCVESKKSLERFQVACKAAGIKLVIDAEVGGRGRVVDAPAGVSKAQPRPPMYMVYMENITPDLASKLLLALQEEDRKAEKAKKGEGQFESLMIQALDEDGRKQLADALGVPRDSLAPPKPRAKNLPAGVDPTKPLSEETLKALDRLAAGQGAKPAANDPTAVLMVYYPNRSRVPPSKEVKEYLLGRKGWHADAIHVVFLLRPSRG